MFFEILFGNLHFFAYILVFDVKFFRIMLMNTPMVPNKNFLLNNSTLKYYKQKTKDTFKNFLAVPLSQMTLALRKLIIFCLAIT